MIKYILMYMFLCTFSASAQMYTETYTTDTKNKLSYEALDLAIDSVISAMQKLPLSLRTSAFITGRPAGYGMYNERQSAIFKPRERLRFYIEPVGYRLKKQENVVSFGLSLDVSVMTSDGQSLYRKDDFINNDYASRHAVTELMLTGELDLAGLEPGGYILELTLHDKLLLQARVISRLPFRISVE